MFSGRQAAARPVPDLHVLGFSFALLLLGEKKAHAAASLFEMEHISLCCHMFAYTRCHMLVVYLLSVVGFLYPVLTIYAQYGYDNCC